MGQVLEVIRTRTHNLHTRIEAHVDLPNRLSSRQDYTELLSRFLGLYRPFENSLQQQSAFLHDAIGWPGAQRVPRLEADLQTLGLSQQAIADLPDAPHSPLPDAADSIWGALYVLEGSNLGGQIIYRQIQLLLGLDQHAGAAFFYGDGPRTGLHWKHFLTALESQVKDPHRAADAACLMFQHFESWLTADSIPAHSQASNVQRISLERP